MASMRFIIENDRPVEMAASGSLLDIVSCVTYLVNKIYRTLQHSDTKAASAFRSMIARTMSDPGSPVWIEAAGEEGETAIAVHLPSKNPNV